MQPNLDQEPTGAPELAVIGQKLRDLRKANNLSQREVADAIGLPQSNLSRIENGKQRLNLSVLVRMLGIYETSIQEFFEQHEREDSTREELASREMRLLAAYRRLPPEDRRDVEGYVDYKLFRARKD